MIRIAGINIPDNKHILISLTYIYGIGISLSNKICKKLNISPNIKVNELLNKDIENIRNEIKKYNIEGDLKRTNSLNIKRLIDINSYRGIRHKKHLPTRGQRTRTNSRTSKGPKKSIKKK